MRKLLLCLVIGLSAAMLFAVDITKALNDGGGSWTSAPGEEGTGGSDLTVTFDASTAKYVKVGFADAEVTATSDAVNPATTAALTNQDDASGKISMDSSESVYVYYDVKTDDTITIALEAQSMATTSQEDNAPTDKIKFYIDPAGGSTITSQDSLPASSSNTVLTYTPNTSDPVKSVKLDIYTTLDDIPVGARGSYSGLVRMYVTAAGE